jgi:hypothetical protein
LVLTLLAINQGQKTVNTFKVVAIFISTIAIVVAMLYGMKLLSSTTTPVVIVKPKQGIECALATSAEAVAIDCWKE